MFFAASPRTPCDRGDAPMSPLSPSYYGVYLGSPDPDSELRKHVYADKDEALKIAKKCKASRFKVFYSIEEAENFAINGPETITSPVVPVGAEKSSPFKAPISQDLVKFRKCIEKGDLDGVINTVSRNPRYLVSSGDTPAILQEGARYNALHVAAKFDKPHVCEFILECINSHRFIQKLYGEEEIKDSVKHRCDILLDLYLNTPDKAANETPLHFASKIGALDVIKVLVSYDKCDKTRRNKQGQLAVDIVGSRKDVSPESKKEIIRLLNSDYYIAVFRPLDPIRPPVLEGPFVMSSPSKPKLKTLLESEMRMSGVAGPMKYEEAMNFKRLWKRPRGSPISSPKSPIASPPPLAFSPSSFKKPDKVIERIGRDLCSEMGVYWVEYWPFLGDFANFQKDKGLDMLERYFISRFSDNEIEKGGKSVAEDSLEDLLDEMKRLCIDSKTKTDTDGQFNYNFNSSPKFDTKFSYSHIDKTCQVYANKLTESLTKYEFMSFKAAVQRCHDLITSCATDQRYSRVAFNRIHSKIAVLVKKKICKDYPSELSVCIEFINNFMLDLGLYLLSPVLCICHKILEALKGNLEDTYQEGDRGNNKSVNEETVRFKWLLLDPCECLSDIEVKPIKKRLDFRSRSFKHYSDDTGLNNLDNKMVIDDCDSDSSFKTPPSSPRFLYRCLADDTLSSNEDADNSSDEEMFSADEGLPVTIEGDCLKEIDRVVYEALDQEKIVPSRHPYIYQWLQDCKRKFDYSSSTPLVLSPLSPAYLKKCENIKLSLREHLLNNSPLSSK